MRLGIIEGPLVSVLHSSANTYISQGCGGKPRLCQQPRQPQGQCLLEVTGGREQLGARWGAGCLLVFPPAAAGAGGFPFICYLHTLATGIEFVPIKTKLALPGILNRLWQSGPLTLSERLLPIPPLQHNARWKPL